MKDFLEQYGFIIFTMIFIWILFVCILFKSNCIPLNLNDQLNVKQEQTSKKTVEQSNISSDNNVSTEHPTHILNSMKHIVKTVGIIIGICFLLIVNISLIINDFIQYNTLSENYKTYYLKKTTMECNPMNVNYEKNCSIVLY